MWIVNTKHTYVLPRKIWSGAHPTFLTQLTTSKGKQQVNVGYEELSDDDLATRRIRTVSLFYQATHIRLRVISEFI